MGNPLLRGVGVGSLLAGFYNEKRYLITGSPSNFPPSPIDHRKEQWDGYCISGQFLFKFLSAHCFPSSHLSRPALGGQREKTFLSFSASRRSAAQTLSLPKGISQPSILLIFASFRVFSGQTLFTPIPSERSADPELAEGQPSILLNFANFRVFSSADPLAEGHLTRSLCAKCQSSIWLRTTAEESVPSFSRPTVA